MDQFCSGLWQPVSAAPLMAEDRSDREANGSGNTHTAAVKCLHQKILEGTLEFVRPFILMKKANAVVFKPLR